MKPITIMTPKQNTPKDLPIHRNQRNTNQTVQKQLRLVKQRLKQQIKVLSSTLSQLDRVHMQDTSTKTLDVLSKIDLTQIAKISPSLHKDLQSLSHEVHKSQ